MGDKGKAKLRNGTIDFFILAIPYFLQTEVAVSLKRAKN